MEGVKRRVKKPNGTSFELMPREFLYKAADTKPPWQIYSTSILAYSILAQRALRINL